jgi:hypothetical protein
VIQADGKPGGWDPRTAFHRAVLAVYADLAALVEVLQRQDLGKALLALDEHAPPGSAPDGDPEFIADLKHAAGRLRSSLATARKLRKDPGVASAFGRGGSFGGISSLSHHDALVDAASEVLEPDAEGATRSGRIARPQSESGVMRQLAVAAAMDEGSWAKLAENLKHEYGLAVLHRHPPVGELKPTMESVTKLGETAPTQKSSVDTAIDEYRAAHRGWDRAIPHVGVSITAADPEGKAFTIEYRLPSGGPMLATTEDEHLLFGFAKSDWSSLRQPILPPTDPEWRAKYDACTAARTVLADAAERLAAVVTGTDSSSSHLRLGALRLAKLLRHIPPVWPTKLEIDLASEINNGRIVEFRTAIKHAKQRQEAAEAAAIEERRKHKAEQAADALIAWQASQSSKFASAPLEGPVLKFERAPDAKQKCLEALAAAPQGIPTHQDIANAIGLEHQTVKEAMAKLSKAKHVRKPDGAWLITDSGRKHLKQLRGE